MKWRHIATVLILCGLPLAMLVGKVQAQSTVEDGLGQLAQAIVEKSTAADKTTIAVLPFPNADGTCSVLSTYIVDELTLRLFSVPESKLQIIERSQLQALLRELKIGASGLLNPETTKQFGNVSGVGALILGNITIIGDQVRVNARLVATDTGITISAAAISIPKTSAIDSLLAKPVVTGLMCGGDSEQLSSAAPISRPQNSSSKNELFNQGNLAINLASVSRSSDKTRVNLVVTMLNTGKDAFKAIWVQPVPAIADDSGNAMYAYSLSGIDGCHAFCGNSICSGWGWFGQQPGQCPANNKDSYSMLYPGQPANVNFVFREWSNGTGDKTIDGDVIAFSGVLQELAEDEKNIQ